MKKLIAITVASLLSVSAILAAETSAVDCSIRRWDANFKKEVERKRDGYVYSLTKVAPKDMAWLRPDQSVGDITETIGYVILGECSWANISNSAELRNILMRLSIVASDHGANAISYKKSGTHLQFSFLRIPDRH